MALLDIEGVRKEYRVRSKRVLALDSVDLSIAEGEFVTIVGPSGCGKSTLLNMVVGLLRSSAGKITFRGERIDGICTRIGYVTQKDNLLPWRTLIENVEIALEIRSVNSTARRETARNFIDRVGLSGFEEHYPHELSGGMRQRANIIRTLIYDPELMAAWAEHVWAAAPTTAPTTAMDVPWTASTVGNAHEVRYDAHCVMPQTIAFDADNDDLFEDSDKLAP